MYIKCNYYACKDASRTPSILRNHYIISHNRRAYIFYNSTQVTITQHYITTLI